MKVPILITFDVEAKYARLILQDVSSGDVRLRPGVADDAQVAGRQDDVLPQRGIAAG